MKREQRVLPGDGPDPVLSAESGFVCFFFFFFPSSFSKSRDPLLSQELRCREGWGQGEEWW